MREGVGDVWGKRRVELISSRLMRGFKRQIKMSKYNVS